MKNRRLIQLLCVLCFTEILGLVFWNAQFEKEAAVRAVSAEIAKFQNPFNEINIQAQNAVVIDLDTNTTIYAKHSDKPKPIASITKLMTTDVALSNIKMDDVITITQKALDTEGNDGLKLDQKWQAKDLIPFMLVRSSNDAAEAIREHIEQSEDNNVQDFISTMNMRGQALGLPGISFQNPSGLDTTEKTPTALASAKDAVLLLQDVYAENPEIIGQTNSPVAKYSSLDGKEYEIKNTNEAIPFLPGLIASKTGFTDSAGGNLVILARTTEGRTLGISVLGSTIKGRFEDTVLLLQTANEYFNRLYSNQLEKYYPW